MSKYSELSPRLRMVADLVPGSARLTDVGTDHAYLPVALILEGLIPLAIAADLRQGPLNRARATARRYGLTDQISFRLCNGLSGIHPHETDAIVIAGMGGETIAAILAGAPWVLEQSIPLVLQPMSSMPDLRAWLSGNGYCIHAEQLARQDDTLYAAMAVGAGEMGQLTPAELWAGKNSAHPLRGMWLEHWLEKTRRALEGLAKAKNENEVAQRRAWLKQVEAELFDMKREWEAWQR